MIIEGLKRCGEPLEFLIISTAFKSMRQSLSESPVGFFCPGGLSQTRWHPHQGPWAYSSPRTAHTVYHQQGTKAQTHIHMQNARAQMCTHRHNVTWKDMDTQIWRPYLNDPIAMLDLMSIYDRRAFKHTWYFGLYMFIVNSKNAGEVENKMNMCGDELLSSQPVKLSIKQLFWLQWPIMKMSH